MSIESDALEFLQRVNRVRDAREASFREPEKPVIQTSIVQLENRRESNPAPAREYVLASPNSNAEAAQRAS